MYFYSSFMYNYFINALTNIFPALSLIAAHLTVPSCFGPPVYNCPHCSATLWYEERINRNKPTSNPQFSFCCMEGRVKLPLLKEPPPLLRYLLSPASGQTGSKYRRNIRTYNTMFAMASMGVRVDKLINKKRALLSFVLVGRFTTTPALCYHLQERNHYLLSSTSMILTMRSVIESTHSRIQKRSRL